jgi:hypothetical protein
MISTSEIKISVVVDEKYLELGVRALHEAFELDKREFSLPPEPGASTEADCQKPQEMTWCC